MLQKLFALADATAAADNADVMQHHELLLPGHLITMFVKVWISYSRSPLHILFVDFGLRVASSI